MNTVLSFGEVLWDAFGEEKKAGGAPMNVARHLVQQGVKVLFASRTGTDKSGKELDDFLLNNGLFSNLIQHDEELPTCEVTVQLDEHNTATYIIPQPVSWDNIRPTAELTESAKNSAAIVFGSLACRTETTRNTLLNLLDQTDALKVFDVNLRPPHYTQSTIEALAAKADLIKMNEEEAELLTSDHKGDLHAITLAIHEKYKANTICITRGEHGAMVWHGGEFYEHPGFKVKVADTVGAGDSFLATLIAGLLKNDEMTVILERACKVGSFVASQRGANPVYPEGLV